MIDLLGEGGILIPVEVENTCTWRDGEYLFLERR